MVPEAQDLPSRKNLQRPARAAGRQLDVERGEFISVVGPSGCGKTTFLRIIAGLEPASSGEVLLDGRAVHAPGGDRGFVFQSDSLLPWRTVFANAIIGREVAGQVGPAERQRTMELLKLVGLEGFENYHPRQLSGGMRQRVNLGACARHRSADPADGRAVLFARCADPRNHADRADAHLGAGAARPSCS
jgi:NitT/TauT family transport system ATP-binding protein